MQASLKERHRRTKGNPLLKSNSVQQAPSSNFASLFIQGPLRRILKRRSSLISLFPRSNTAPADCSSSSSLRCFGNLQIPPSPLSLRPSLQTQLVELHCPSIHHHRSRELLHNSSPSSSSHHPIYIQSTTCSSVDIDDDGQGGYGGDASNKDKPAYSSTHDKPPHIAVTPSTSNEAVNSARMTLLTSSSSTSALPDLLSSKSNSMTDARSSSSRFSSSVSGLHNAAGTSSTSLGDISAYSTSYPGESSNIVIGPNGVLSPRSSILRNPSNKKTFVDAWRSKDGSGPAVLQIQARQTVRDREAEKEQEKISREKEIERELKEMEQAEKVWGIPKKAFYMGLGEINFNAQMAILGGWGNGSGPATDFRPNMPTLGPRKISTGKVKTKREREREREKKQAVERAEERRKEKEKVKDDEGDSEDSIDAEELAALNAIINTRRSMEAASALASRNNRIVAVRKSTSQDELQEKENRPSLVNYQHTSEESVQEATERAMADRTRSSSRPRPRIARTSSEAQRRQSRIRFAPLPQAYNSIPMESPSQGVADSMPSTPIEAMPQEGFTPKEPSGGVAQDDEGSDTSDMDEPEECEDGTRGRSFNDASGSKSRWYLMGMPKSVFRPQTYRSLRRPTSLLGAEAAVAGELGTSPGVERSSMERRGRRTSRLRRSASLAGSIKSRSSSVNSNDDEERMRRRQMIRASRPGGTGMVTLPDGTRIRARRVGEEESEEEDFNEWGFAGLSRRRSVEDAEAISGQVKSGDKRASDDEDMDTGSGMAWVKRRRRAREESKQRMEKAQDHSEEETSKTETERPELPKPVKKTSDVADQTKSTSQAPSLNALQAAEVRRRHEREVAALGAEVLESIAKQKKAKQNPARSATWDAGQPPPPSSTISDAATKPSLITQTNLSSVTDQRLKGRGRPRRSVSMFNEEEEDKSDRPSLGPIDTTQAIGNLGVPLSPQFISEGVKTPTGIETPTKNLSRVSSQLSPPLPQQSTPLNEKDQLTTRLPAVDDSPIDYAKQQQQRHERRSLSPRPASFTSQEIQPNSPLQLSPSSLSTRRRSGPPSLLSADLPRKPDGRGYAVVPLPIEQLGRRPERPREGRVWQFDDDDDDDSDDKMERQSEKGRNASSVDDNDEDDDDDDEFSEEDTDGEEGVKQGENDDDDDDDDDDENTMNEEELAEEERRTAIQKQRATTRAAGAEMVSSLAKPNTGKAPPRSPKLKTEAKMEDSSSIKQTGTSTRSIAIPVHQKRQLGRLEGDAGNASDISDDADLWPPTLSGTQLSRTLSGNSDVNTGRRSSTTSSSNIPIKEASTLAAHSVKARIVRDRRLKEKKEKEKIRAIKRKEEQDLDYGWPKSLHGSSLYH